MRTLVFRPERIREARLARSMSQKLLARKIGTSRQNVLRWENGKHKPSPETVAAIARETRQPLDFFFGEDEDEEEEPDALRDALDNLYDVLHAGIAQAREETSQ